MNPNKRLKEYFKKEGYKNSELSPILGYSETMVGRYLNGVKEFNMPFLRSVIENFPEVDLNHIFKGTSHKLPKD